MKLYIGNKNYSSWSLRGWLACKQSGLPFEEIVVPMWTAEWERARDAELAPSAGRVPILWDGDAPVWDSLAILDYLDAKSGGTRFWPRDDAARGLARSICAEMHSSFSSLRAEHGMNIRKACPAHEPSEAVKADVTRIMALWSMARERFGNGGPYLFGEFGAADIMFAPVCTRFRTYDLPIAPFAEEYVAAVFDHPFMRDWVGAAHDESWVIEKYEQE